MLRMTSLCIILLFVNDVSAVIQNKNWWFNMVFYEINPHSFMDSDGDGIGDLKGLISKLMYFPDTGIGGIWLSPLYMSPFFTSGYDISDFENIYEKYGTLVDMKNLIIEAKKLKLRVILDLIPNHTSILHNWFVNSVRNDTRYRDYYIWKDGKNNNTLPPNDWLNMDNDCPWTRFNNQWYFHQFDYREPDLNYSNPDVLKEIDDIIKFWLQYEIDGFYVHDISYIYEQQHPNYQQYTSESLSQEDEYTHIFMQNDTRPYQQIVHWRKVLDKYASDNNKDEKILITEVMNDDISKFYRYFSQVPVNLKFVTEVNRASNAEDFKNIIDDWMYYTPPNAVPNWMIGNHNYDRIESRFPGRGDQMIMLQMILPGVVFTYYGEEIGMVNKNNVTCADLHLSESELQVCYDRHGIYYPQLYRSNRSPFQWNRKHHAGFSTANHTWFPVHENFKKVNVADQVLSPKSYHYMYTTLARMRRENYVLNVGILETLLMNDDTVLVVFRQYNTKFVIFLMNFDYNEQIVDLTAYIEFQKYMWVKMSSLNCRIKVGKKMNLSKINVPSRASLILISEDYW